MRENRIMCSCLRRWADGGGNAWFGAERVGDRIVAAPNPEDASSTTLTERQARDFVFGCGCARTLRSVP